MPRSNNANVVPTGFCSLPSPIFISAIAAKDFPASTAKPNNANKVCDGSLYGNGNKDSFIDCPVTSTSLNSPGCKGSS